MAKKQSSSVGIEIANHAIHAVRILVAESEFGVDYTLESCLSVNGDYEKDDELIAGLRDIRRKMNVSSSEKIVSCIEGKQIFTTQISFKKLPHNDMLNALRLEVRKTLPFDIYGASLDYQIIKDSDDPHGDVQVLAVVVAHVLIKRHLRVLEKAELKPFIVDVLPLALANAFWNEAAGNRDNSFVQVVLHVGPSVSTLVFDGDEVPFFSRNIYFAADKILGESSIEMRENERNRQFGIFRSELVRTLAFYEKTYKTDNIKGLYLSGEFADSADLKDMLTRHVGVQLLEKPATIKTNGANFKKGYYDIAIALAMRKIEGE